MEKGKVRKKALLQEPDSLQQEILPGSLQLRQCPDSLKDSVPGEAIPDPKENRDRIQKFEQ